VAPNIHAQNRSQTQKSAKPIYLNTNYSFRERAADLVSRMTLAEEVKQLHTNHAPAIPRLSVQEYYYWSEGQHGVNAMYGDLHDGTHTSGNYSGHDPVHSTSFPTNFASTMSWDPQLVYAETQAISDEARGFLDKSLFGKGQNNLGSSPKNYGFLTYWAPTINEDRDPRWGRTDEAFGEDPYLASRMAGAFVNGMQGQTMDGKSRTGYLKVAATAKHFALNNVENVRQGMSSNAGDRAIRDYYMKTFRYLIEQAHVAGLMTSYNAINGTPAVANTYTVNELAHRTFGFNGYTTSDCGAVGTTYKLFPYGHNWAPPGWKIRHKGKKAIWINKKTGETISAAAGGQAFAVRAGTELNCTGAEYTFQNINDAIKAGILSKGVIDRALTHVFTIRMRTGEFDPPDQVPYTKITKSVIQSPAHQKLAEKVAENSLVLLKNNSVSGHNKPLLPMDSATIHKIVILGNLANKVELGGYSSDPSLQVSAVDGIKAAFKKANPDASVIFYSAGTSTTATNPASLSAQAKKDIKSADAVIVFVGTNEAVAREGHDRASLAMLGNYDSLIYQVIALGNPNMALVIQSDGPVKINYIKHNFPAIVFSGYNGERQGTALASVLLGKKNPSGHLDFTWYKDATQLPNKNNYRLTPKKTSGLGRTYQYFTGKPTFPFGYGLSYTHFKYSRIHISTSHASPKDSVTLRFDVTNTGDVPGATVAQLYVAPPKISAKELPIKQLKGFEKTKVLNPGQMQHISLTVPLGNLSFWNEQKLTSIVYIGKYQFQIGKSSRNIIASKTVNIQGKLAPRVTHVTIEPPKLIYHVGETLNLNGKNQWIKSDIVQNKTQPHAAADNIVETVRNNGSFVNLSRVHVHYHSNRDSVATVNKQGIVKAVGKGVVTITATVNGVSGSTVIVVK
jgi:beta-glucosidase-like glycosyl hydrolase